MITIIIKNDMLIVIGTTDNQIVKDALQAYARGAMFPNVFVQDDRTP